MCVQEYLVGFSELEISLVQKVGGSGIQGVTGN
jgi:hypothetical protein